MILYDANFMLNLLAEALRMILMLSAPMLIAAVGVGVLVALFQAATQVQEQSLSFAPKILATFAAVFMFSNWIAVNIVKFFMYVLLAMPHVVVK